MKRALGYLLLAAGLFLGASHLFLALWTWAAHGQPDIIARGSFLLALLSPYFSAAVAATTVGVGVVVARRRRQNVLALGPLTLGAVGLTYATLYLDRTSTVWRVLGTIRLTFGSLGYTSLEVILLLAGAFLSVSRDRVPKSLEAAV
jgi:hypothetical protein